MIRRIIKIDSEKCNGCGACASACHEGAIGMIDGKAYLLREDYCDGLGDCLPACPTGAISFEQREAAVYDEAAVQAAKAQRAGASGCPGAQARAGAPGGAASALAQWPVQLKLTPVRAPYFHGADLLIAADCAAYAHGDFHNTFMRGRITLIGCPKLDGIDYAGKLAQIIAENDIARITVVRMEVPCCGGMEHAVRRALQASGKQLPLAVVTLTTNGTVLR